MGIEHELEDRAEVLLGKTGFSFAENEYSVYSPGEPGNRAVLVYRSYHDEGQYESKINFEGLLIKKSDLKHSVLRALAGSKTSFVQGVWVYDDVFWDDSIATGDCWDGPKVADVEVDLTFPSIDADPKPSVFHRIIMPEGKMEKLLANINDPKTYLPRFEINADRGEAKCYIKRWSGTLHNFLNEDLYTFELPDIKKIISAAVFTHRQTFTTSLHGKFEQAGEVLKWDDLKVEVRIIGGHTVKIIPQQLTSS